MIDQLRRELAQLSGEAKPADLYDRVMAGSRRRARWQRAAGATAATAAGVAIAFVMISLRPAGAPLEVGPSVLTPAPSRISPRPLPTPPPRPSVDPAVAGPLQNAKLEIVIPAGRGVCQFTAGVGKVQINVLYDARLYSSAVFPDRPIGAALIEIQVGKNTTPLRQIHIYRMPDTTKDAVLLDRRLLEFMDATKIEAVGRDLHVTINGEVMVVPVPD